MIVEEYVGEGMIECKKKKEKFGIYCEGRSTPSCIVRSVSGKHKNSHSMLRQENEEHST